MQQTTASAALLPSSERPIPLRRRDDIVVEEIQYRGVPFPVIKDPVGLKYYRLQPEQYEVLNLLNGARSLEQVREAVQTKFPTVHLVSSDIQGLITDLHEKGLLISERLGQGESAIKRARERWWSKFRQTAMNPLYLRLPGWDPDGVLTRLEPYWGWLFRPVPGFLLMAFVASSWLFLAMHFGEIRQRLPEFHQFFGWPNLIYLWVTLAGAKILHEFGHGLSCKHFGGECHSMGVMLLVFSPTLYCDVTDAWMMKNKWHRIVIGAAGMYVELILAAVAIFVWYSTRQGLLNHLALNIFFVSTVTTVIFNANPLLRYDGYYMLADYLEIPNLRAKSSKMLSQTFAWWCAGIDVPDDPFMPTSGKFWFLLFTVASSIYRWFVLFAITIFLYTMLKPYRLQSLGILLAVGSIAGILGGAIWGLYRFFSVPRRDPMSRPRIIISTIVVIALICGVMMIPVPWYEQAVFHVEPIGIQHVYTVIPGALVEIDVQPGDWVEQGNRLALLRTFELIDRRDELQKQLRVEKVDPEMYRELQDPDGQRLAEQRLMTTQQQLNDVVLQLAQATVTAPVSGRVVASPRVMPATLETLREQMPVWHGTPLDQENLGTFLDARTHLCSIAPSETFQAVLLINQGDRDDLRVGDGVRLKFELFPAEVWDGKVVEFSDQDLQIAPPGLSNKYGGSLPTVTDDRGRERLVTPVYQAIVAIDNPPETLKTGMRGTARFIVEQRTLYDWIYRWFRSTFKFRL